MTSEMGLASFFPGYFAMVMATGIVAIGCHLLGVPVLDVGLAAVACAAFVVFAAATIARLVRYPRLLLAELTSHARGFAFTTTVAAVEVLGVIAVSMFGWRGVAWGSGGRASRCGRCCCTRR